MNRIDKAKRETVLEYLEKYPKHPSRTIARMLHTAYPEIWLKEYSARSMVQRFRGEFKEDRLIKPENNMDFEKFKRTKEEKKEAIAKKHLPDTDYEKLEDFIIPKGNNNILFLSDIHLPYHDPKALQLAIDYGKENKVNAVYLNGDTLDMYQASRFIKDRRLRDLQGELEMCRNFLEYLQNELKCPIYYKMGNHEDRWENYLKINAPEMFGIPDFRLENLLRFGQFGVTEIKSKQLTYAGKLALLHGHEFGHSVFSPVNAARGLYMRAKASAVIGHHHQTSEHSEKDLSGEVVTTWSVGCLCGLQPEYYPFNKWNHGFAHIRVHKDGTYNMDNLRIINGKIV
jgi:predicted phosphodiesterase